MDISVGIAVIGAIIYAIKQAFQYVFDYIVQRYSYSFCVTSHHQMAYNVVNEWLHNLHHPVLEKHTSVYTYWNETIKETQFSIDYGTYMLQYKDAFVIVEKSNNKERWDNIDTLHLRIYSRTDIVYTEVCQLLRTMLYADKLFVYPVESTSQVLLISKRSFDTLFGPEKCVVQHHLDQWKQLIDVYKQMMITYKTGLLFYGEPGTGKTSMARAVASYLGFALYSITFSEYEEGADLLNKILFIPQHSVILFEDIDVCLTDRTSKFFDIMLNILDGILSPEHVVMIATTNHIEKIDPALLRDGRFDCNVHFALLTKDYAQEMCRTYSVSEDILETLEFPISSAVVQNKILHAKYQEM